MLILTRKSGEQIAIGDDIVINFLEIKGTQVKVGIEAPRHITIHRQEVYERVKEENRAAAAMTATDLSLASEFYSHINTKKEET
ncbi:MAG: carbon storage regulator CsrA [Desulfobacterium sp.]